MADERLQPGLGEALRAERRRRRLSLRDLADEIDVGFNTLSRVERGHVPDLRNYERITSWLSAPGQVLFNTDADDGSTPDLIARHLYADERLNAAAANKMLQLIRDMYTKLAAPSPAFSVHLRSSQTFLPEVGPLLADVLKDMQAGLVEEAL